MLLRHTVVMVAIILAAVVATAFFELLGGSPARMMQWLLYCSTVLLVAGFIWWKCRKK